MATERAMPNRQAFSPTPEGTDAYEYLMHGGTCDVIVNGQRCGKPAVSVLEFDVLGNTERLNVCSPLHQQIAQNNIAADLAHNNKTTVFGQNGFGRDRMKPVRKA